MGRPREKGWEEQTVAELDSALNGWFDSIPDHCMFRLWMHPQRLSDILSRSAVGSPTRGRDLLCSVCESARGVLFHTDRNPPSVHPVFAQRRFSLFRRTRNLRECRTCI